MNALPAAAPEAALASFAATLRLRRHSGARCCAAPRTLMIDWFGSALAGKGARPVESIARFAESMGPADGPCEILIHRRRTSPLVAAMVNAAASHHAEQDDVHNGSVFHPATVVFPPALAAAQALGAAAPSCSRRRSPATRSASASASFSAARTTRSSIRPARPARWPLRRRSGGCSG